MSDPDEKAFDPSDWVSLSHYPPWVAAHFGGATSWFSPMGASKKKKMPGYQFLIIRLPRIAVVYQQVLSSNPGFSEEQEAFRRATSALMRIVWENFLPDGTKLIALE